MAERALVDETQVRSTIGEGEPGPDVRGERSVGIADYELAAHAQVGDKRVRLDRKPQVLAATPDDAYRRAAQHGGEIVRTGEVPAGGTRMQYLDIGDGPAADVPLQASSDRFDLGQLGHGEPSAFPLGPRRSARGRRRVAQPGGAVPAIGGIGFGPADLGAQCRPRRLGGLLLGFLLGAALALARTCAADPGDGTERLLVIGPALVDQVLRARPGLSAAVSSWSEVFQSRPAPRRADLAITGSNSRCTSGSAASMPPSRYTAPITASSVSARIDDLSRPPVPSSPLPSRT